VFAGTAGETQTFTVATLDDAAVEGSETFTVTLDAVNALVTDTDTATGTITDNDTATITVDSPAGVVEGNTITFTISVDNLVAGGFSVTTSYTNVTATGGTDYDNTADVVNFLGTAGETQTFTVSTTDDATIEPTETFTVSLTPSNLAIVHTDTGTGTILDNDTIVDLGDAEAREFNWFTLDVNVGVMVPLQALYFEVSYSAADVAFLDDLSTAVTRDATTGRIAADAVVDWADDGAGTAYVWIESVTGQPLNAAITGAASISRVATLQFRLNRDASDSVATVTDVIAIGTDGLDVTMGMGAGNIDINNDIAPLDVDDSGTVDTDDGVLAYRAMKYGAMGGGLIPIKPAAWATAKKSNLLSDDEIIARTMALGAALNVDALNGVLADQDGVYIYRHLLFYDASGNPTPAQTVPASHTQTTSLIVNGNIRPALTTKAADATFALVGRTEATTALLEIQYNETLRRDTVPATPPPKEPLVLSANLAGVPIITRVQGTVSGVVTGGCTFTMDANARLISIIPGAAFTSGETVSVDIDETTLEDVDGNVGATNPQTINIVVP